MALVDTSGLGPNGEPVTTTTQQVTPSTSHSENRAYVDPEARAKARAWFDKLDAEEAASKSGAPVIQPTAEDVAADVASQERSQKVIDKAQAAAQPDPFDAPAGPVPTIGGKPIMAPGQMPASATPQAKVDRPFTSQEFGATAEMKGPQTFESAKDEANAYKAQVEARVNKERAEQMAAAEAERLRMQQEIHERINAAAAEQSKAAAKLYEEPSTWSKIMQAIAVGLGAYGAGLTRGPNHALEVIKEQNARDLEAKKLRLNAAAEKIKAAGASQEQLEKFVKSQQERLIAASKAQIEAADAKANTMLAPFPQAQRQWAEASAKLKAENAEKVAKYVQDATKGTTSDARSVDGTKVTVAEAKGGQPQRETVNEIVASKQQAELLREFESIVKANPKAWEEYKNANREAAEFEIAKQGPTGGLLKAGQSIGLGATPIALDQRLDKISDPKVAADAKRLNQIWPIIQTGEARILDPVGVLNEASQEQARKHLNMYTMKPEEAVKLSEQFRSQHEERSAMLSKGRAYKASSAASEAKPATAAKQRGLTAEDRQARDWAKANPKDPRARAILLKVAKKQTVGE